MAYLSGFVSRYLNPFEVEAVFRDLAGQYPSICRFHELPWRTHGYAGVNAEARGRHPMHLFRIGVGDEDERRPAVLLMRSSHAREWINALAVVETARQLVENYRPDDPDSRVREIVSLLNRVDILIIPETNPDGARLSFFDPGRRMWRKNLRPPENGGCLGVDCNRNFPKYWGETGSSGDPCTEIYRGPHPVSEPETANVVHVTERYRNIVFAIDSHSHGNAMFRPTASGGRYIDSLPVAPEDENIYVNLEAAMNRGIRKVRGIPYHTGTTSNHAGTSDEFFFFNRGIFGFDLECGQAFQPPEPEAVVAAREVAEAVKALARCAAGRTGIDITALMRRREEMEYDELPVPEDSPSEEDSGLPWSIPRLPPEQWRRFLTRCEVGASKRERVRRQLEERGFDVLDHGRDEVVLLITSQLDLAELLRLGYQSLIIDDFMSDAV